MRLKILVAQREEIEELDGLNIDQNFFSKVYTNSTTITTTTDTYTTTERATDKGAAIVRHEHDEATVEVRATVVQQGFRVSISIID